MAKKLLMILGAIVLVGLIGAATYVALGALFPKDEQSVDSEVSSGVASSTDDGAASDTDPVDTDAGQAGDTSVATVQHDVAVKNMLAKVEANIISYQANNRGVLPQTNETLTSFTQQYLVGVDMTNPVSNNTYTLNLTELRADTIFFQPGYTCNEDATASTVGTARQFALTVTLPSGAVYCTAP